MVHLSDEEFARRFSMMAKYLARRPKGRNSCMCPDFYKVDKQKIKLKKKEHDKKYYEMNRERIKAKCRAYAAKKKEAREEN